MCFPSEASTDGIFDEEPHPVTVPSYINPYIQLSVPNTRAQINKYGEKIGKLLIPIMSLTSLASIFAAENPGGTTNIKDGLFRDHYGSLLVLGSMDIAAKELSDGVASIFQALSIDSIDPHGATAVLMLIPLEWAAWVDPDPVLNMRKLSFAQASNYFGFKSASKQVNHYVTQLTTPYVSQIMGKDAHPVVKKMIAKSISASILTAPWLATILVDAARSSEQREKKIYFDSIVGFFFSTAMTSMGSVTEMGVHHFRNQYNVPTPNESPTPQVDEHHIVSELITAGIFMSIWAGTTSISKCIPLPTPVQTITREISKNSMKIAGYKMSATLHNILYQQLQSTISTHLIMFITTGTLAYLTFQLSPIVFFDEAVLSALTKGFGIPNMKALGFIVSYLTAPIINQTIEMGRNMLDMISIGLHLKEGGFMEQKGYYDVVNPHGTSPTIGHGFRVGAEYVPTSDPLPNQEIEMIKLFPDEGVAH
ncbi:hypothetical protein ACH42_02985 [Endozoicomonas sp. (ex Bugula neritina AB1)]|nr:hypothetical protein ACH42_02985 [Endozoicomonas sp. (ex Bugula neritina AB1)]